MPVNKESAMPRHLRVLERALQYPKDTVLNNKTKEQVFWPNKKQFSALAINYMKDKWTPYRQFNFSKQLKVKKAKRVKVVRLVPPIAYIFMAQIRQVPLLDQFETHRENKQILVSIKLKIIKLVPPIFHQVQVISNNLYYSIRTSILTVRTRNLWYLEDLQLILIP